jgi:lipopolysaccharide transport system ATP-binding protein
MSSSRSEVLCDVQNVYKKYCRKLHQSLRYGLIDLFREASSLGLDKKLRRQEFYAVKNANFRVHRGECIALLGPNGAGKSTMLKMLNGLLKPNSGSIRIRGRVGALIELGSGFNPILSGRENVYINSAILGLSKRQVDERFDEILDFCELGDAIEDPVKNYSSGMRARLGYSVAAFLRPELLLMDEVLVTGDVRFRIKCFDHLQTLIDAGTSIVIVSHAVSRLPRLCTRAIVFAQGETRYDGSIEDGISVYEELLNLKQLVDHKRLAEVSGRQPIAWVEKAELIDTEGRPIELIEHGQDVNLRIYLKAQQPVPDARVVVSIDNNSVIVATMGTRSGCIPLDEKGAVVELCIPKLTLLNGVYLINVKLLGYKASEVYHYQKGAILLKVNSLLRNGIMAMPHKWKL